MREVFSYYTFVSCFLCHCTFSSVLVPFLHAFISGLFRRILYSRRTATYFFLVLGTFCFCRTLREPRKQQDPQWYLRIILFFFPHAKERPLLERSGEATAQRGSYSHKEKSGEFQWLFGLNISRKIRTFFSYVIFILKSQGKIIKGHLVRNCILKYRVAILNLTDSMPLLIIIHLLLYVRVFMQYKSHICL